VGRTSDRGAPRARPPAARAIARDLLSAAATLIAERGPQGFSLREVARRAGVSEAAPYWHFSSREALLAAVAEQGFVELAAAMAEVRARVTDPRRQLQELGIAYVRFALARPSHLRIMFGPEIGDKAAHPALHTASERAFGLLVATIADAQHAGCVRAGDPRELAVAAWALVHGLSALLIDRQLREYAGTARDAERLAERVTGVLQAGLAPRAAEDEVSAHRQNARRRPKAGPRRG
jgi:AcrR family transcriptional regulator